LATIKDVAERAGISTGTVDRILHRRGRFSEVTAGKVYAAVKELGYEPNLLARNLSTSRTCRLAVVIPSPNQDSRYWSLPLAGMERAAEELAAYGVTLNSYYFDRYNRESYPAILTSLHLEDYDGLIIAPLLEKETRPFLKGLKIPYVFIDTDLEGTVRLAYAGQNSRSGGQLAAKLLNLLSRGREGAYLIIKPLTDNIHLAGRISGFTESIKREYSLLSTGIEAVHNRQEYFDRLDEMGASSSAGIYVTDASAHYAAAYLKERHCEEVPLIGFDLVEENRAAIRSGLIDFILTQQPAEQGYAGVNILYRRIMLGEDNPGDQIMVPHIVTKENLPEEEK
jgi:LacI family transcriptional regulator